MPVMVVQCPTCPFREDEDGRPINPDVMTSVMSRVLEEASQICHHPRTKGKKQTHLCRGARDFQLTVLFRMGFLEAPTDEAWNKKRRELNV